MYKVELSRDAKRFFERANASLQRRLDRCFDRLKVEPHGGGSIKRLAGKLSDQYRYRVGDYRVIYRVDERRQMGLRVKNSAPQRGVWISCPARRNSLR